ncbi:MAG: sugar ABC transporter substrate-binding protein [Anaerolineae bacterium]|nr:sugar ABC transporter substrate-binding protein [Anaerolineae bacterium]
MATYTLGFSNLSETIPFAVLVREGLEAVAAQHGLELIVRDNAFNNERALENARYFVEQRVDLAIIFHIDERQGEQIRQLLFKVNPRIPIIAVDIPIQLEVFFGIDNYQAGYLPGQALGQWINTHWDGQVDKLLVVTEQRAVSTIRERMRGSVEGLRSQVALDLNHNKLDLDGGTRYEITRERVTPVLEGWFQRGFHRIAVSCSNDDTAIGVLDAARALGHEERVAVIGQGANLAVQEFENNPNSHFIASAAYFPERYGERLIDLAQRMLAGERVPLSNHIVPVLVTQENYREALPNRAI